MLPSVIGGPAGCLGFIGVSLYWKHNRALGGQNERPHHRSEHRRGLSENSLRKALSTDQHSLECNWATFPSKKRFPSAWGRNLQIVAPVAVR
jgi:hypothetical protein